METNKYAKEDLYLNAKKKVKAIKGFYWHLAVYIVINGFITVNKVIRNVLENGETYFDAIFDIGTFFIWTPWGIGVLIHGLFVFEAFSLLVGKNWEERKIKELMEKESKEIKEFKK